jgi:hypothetical protein
VGIHKGVGDTAASLRGFVDALGLQHVPTSADGGVPLEVTRVDPPQDTPPRVGFSGRLGTNHVRYVVHGITVNGASYAVMTTVTAPTADALAGVLDSFAP